MREPYGPCGRCGKPVYRGRAHGNLMHPQPFHERCFRRTRLDDQVRAYKAAIAGSKENLV